jgi:chemotaxis protein methyltransferase CheR
MAAKIDLENIEIKLLLDGVYKVSGFDFRDYAQASLKRRIHKCMLDEDVNTISGFQERILHNPESLNNFLLSLSIDITELFRDPDLYCCYRKKIIPVLRTYPFFRIWHAGCSTGEEAYSDAIILIEEGLYDRARIYATDFNEAVLDKARKGIFPQKIMKTYISNYQQACGNRAFSEYYTAKFDNVQLNPSLQTNITWAQHNLVTDKSFNEFQVVFCRNVMIYFNKSLQDQVLKLLYESLCLYGFLILGKKESLKFSPFEDKFEMIDLNERIYKKIK